MTPAEIEQIKLLLDIIKSGGAVAALTIISWAFYTGKVVPRNVVETMLDEADSRTMKLVRELRDDIRAAVRDGVTDALSNGSNGSRSKL